ncbi:MAG: hypothetical protein M5R38_07460 [Candidatus Methylomirabilis sp.]|nr:hypothetical protein [Candidatus Methylomirabilis sp.]
MVYQQGAPTKGEQDLDADGRIDRWIFYEKGRVVRAEESLKRDGKITPLVVLRQWRRTDSRRRGCQGHRSADALFLLSRREALETRGGYQGFWANRSLVLL